MFRRHLACLIAVASLASTCLAAETGEGPKVTVEPLTRGRGTAIVANADALTEDLARYVKAPKSPRDEAVLDDVRDVMAHPSSWRWYYRDHGILIAVPVSERLGFGTRANAEQLLGDVTRRFIYQRGWGKPTVQVVFIEPEIPCLGPCGAGATFASAAAGAACGCR